MRATSDDFQVDVPIDAENQRAAITIVAFMRGRLPRLDLGIGGELDEPWGAPQWRRIAEEAPFVTLRSDRVAATAFFRLFTLNFWTARRSINRSGGPATVYFTVDCKNHGYQLEYWPRFLFSPKVFGPNLTRPVSATIPVNQYRFQGWINNTVTPDGGLYMADANNKAVTLRAF